MRTFIGKIGMASAFVGLIALTAQAIDARGRGGGARGGGATSMSRGGGAHAGASAGTGFSRGGSYSRPAGGASASQRPSGIANRGNINTGNVNRGNVNTGNINTGNINRGNVNTGNINTGNINVHNVHVDNGWGGWHDYPIARGAAIGAVAVATTAAVLGSAYYALPPACAPYPWKTYTYYNCGGAYYRPQYEGDTVVYVVVAKPK